MRASVVYKKSRIERGHRAPDADTEKRWSASHDRQVHTLATVRRVLDERTVEYEVVYRADLAPLTGMDLVIVVGGDGTFIDASHFVDDVPMLGVNSDPVDSIGFFSAATAETFDQVFAGWTDLPRHKLTRIETVVDGVPIRPLALNDVLVAHANPAATWRGQLSFGDESRSLKNSGVLVSTAAGSTAWSYQEGGNVLPIDSQELQVILRAIRDEPPHATTQVHLHSLTRDGKLYIDGPYHTHELGPGSHATLKPGLPVTVLGDLPQKRQEFTGH